jgi:hypothetical protein
MPGPVPPDWGIPPDFLRIAAQSIYDRSSGGLIHKVDGQQRFVRLVNIDGAVTWSLQSRSETPGMEPSFHIEDNTTVEVLTTGTWSDGLKSVLYRGVPYTLSIQESRVTGKNIVVAIAATVQLHSDGQRFDLNPPAPVVVP